MGLNKSNGNMYEFITHTWNTVKGECPHGCTYCYMKRYGKQNSVRFDEKELKTDLGKNNFIFVGSSCDMWAEDIDMQWINKTLDRCNDFDNKYLFQTKNTKRFCNYIDVTTITDKSIFCTTIESNIHYPDIMMNSPPPSERAYWTKEIIASVIPVYITIEPIMDFDLDKLLCMIHSCKPKQVNIGADTGGHNLPEPPKEKILELIRALSEFTVIHKKNNLARLLK